jgi:hypothetical protein
VVVVIVVVLPLAMVMFMIELRFGKDRCSCLEEIVVCSGFGVDRCM